MDNIIKIQRIYRIKNIKKNYKKLQNLFLIQQIKKLNYNDFNNYIKQTNNFNIIHDFVKSLQLFFNKNIITTDNFIYLYLIFGYSNQIFANLNCIKVQKIIKSTNNIINKLHIINQLNTFNYFILYNILINYQTIINTYICSTTKYNEQNICHIDKQINEFYECFSLQNILPTNILLNEQISCIDNIYKACGDRGISYFVSNMSAKINIYNLDKIIINKISKSINLSLLNL